MKKICFALTLLLCCGSAFAFGSVAGEKGPGITAGFSRDDRLEVVKDDIYRLMWQDDRPIGKMTHSEALRYCDDLKFAGYGDWRLPTVNELLSITDDTRFEPAINEAFKTSHTRRTIRAKKAMAGTVALLVVPTSCRLTRGSCFSGVVPTLAGSTVLLAASCGASETIDF